MNIYDDFTTTLVLRPSTILDSGLGVFTLAPIFIGVPVCEYKGNIVIPQAGSYSDYFLDLNLEDNSVIDASPYSENSILGFGGFVNDRYSKDRVHPPEKLEGKEYLEWEASVGYNCVYWRVPQQNFYLLLSIRDIEESEELFVNYGDSYWEGRNATEV